MKVTHQVPSNIKTFYADEVYVIQETNKEIFRLVFGESYHRKGLKDVIFKPEPQDSDLDLESEFKKYVCANIGLSVQKGLFNNLVKMLEGALKQISIDKAEEKK